MITSSFAKMILFSDDDIKYLNQYINQIDLKRSITQCGGTCYFEATVSHLELSFGQLLGSDVYIDRVDLFKNLISHKRNSFVNKTLNQKVEKALLFPHKQKIHYLDGGNFKEILEVITEYGVKLLSEKKAKDLYIENKIIYDLYQEISQFYFNFRKLVANQQKVIIEWHGTQNKIIIEQITNDINEMFPNTSPPLELTALLEKLEVYSYYTFLAKSPHDILYLEYFVEAIEKTNFMKHYGNEQKKHWDLNIPNTFFIKINSNTQKLKKIYNETILNLEELYKKQYDLSSLQLLQNITRYKDVIPRYSLGHYWAQGLNPEKSIEVRKHDINDDFTKSSWLLLHDSLGLFYQYDRPNTTMTSEILKMNISPNKHLVQLVDIVTIPNSNKQYAFIKNSYGMENGIKGHYFIPMHTLKKVSTKYQRLKIEEIELVPIREKLKSKNKCLNKISWWL